MTLAEMFCAEMVYRPLMVRITQGGMSIWAMILTIKNLESRHNSFVVFGAANPYKKKPNPAALLCPDQKVSYFFPFAAKRGSWLLLAVELAIYILKENCVLETFDVTELKENLFSNLFLQVSTSQLVVPVFV
jgi:hypothetical protein